MPRITAAQKTITQTVAIRAGYDAAYDYLKNQTAEYDFSLQLPRLAYTVGLVAYLDKMIAANVPEKINRVAFEGSIDKWLKESKEEAPMTIKLNFLLSSLLKDADLFSGAWNQQIAFRNLTTPPFPRQAAGPLSTAATVAETRVALMSYYRATCAEAARGPAFAAAVQQAVVCIDKWGEMVGEDPWAAGAAAPPAPAAANNGRARGPDAAAVAAMPIAVEDQHWELGANGRFNCLVCPGHNGIVHWSSLKRHFQMTHAMTL